MAKEKSISESDIIQHVLKIGIDTSPPINLSNMQTRLNAFAEEAQRKWPEMYKTTTSGGGAFSITHEFHSETGASSKGSGPSFVLVDRGPIFIYPLVVPELDRTNVANHWEEWFRETFEFFFSKRFPELKIFRLGLVRELVFDTKEMSCLDALRADAEAFGGSIDGGEIQARYVAGDHNISVHLNTIKINRKIKLPVGPQIDQGESHGLIAKLDVNNRLLRELQGADIELILDLAGSLWPAGLIQYINGRFAP